MRRIKNWQNILIIALIFAISQLDAVSAQTPCDNVTQYLEDTGVVEQPFYVYSEHTRRIGNKPFATGQLLLGVSSKSPGFTGKALYYIDCESGNVFDHSPSASEIFGVPKPEKIAESLFLKMKTVSTDTPIKIEIYTGVDLTPEVEEELRRIGATDIWPTKSHIYAITTPEQHDIIREYDWVDGVYYYGRGNITSKQMISIETTLHVTPELEDQIRQTGAEVKGSNNFYIGVTATASQIETIAELEWIDRIVLHTSTVAMERESNTIPSNPIFIAGSIILLGIFLIVKRARGAKKDE